MSTRTRIVTTLFTAAALVAATVTPAAAQEAPEVPAAEETFYVGASTAIARISVLGNAIGTFAGTAAVAEQLPEVNVESFGFRGPGDIEVGATFASVDEAGESVRDPEEGTACGLATLPEDIPIAELVSLAEVCSASIASLTTSGLPNGSGAADAGILTINGQLLDDLIFGLLLDPLMEQLSAATAPLEDAVLAPVGEALDAVCDELPAGLNPVEVVEAADESGLPVGDVIQALPNGSEILAQVDSDCLLSLATQVDLVGVAADLAEETVRASLLSALDRDLLQVIVGSSMSSVTGDVGGMIARAENSVLAIKAPSLQFLLDAVDALVVDTLQDVIDQTAAIVPAELESVVAAIPALDTVTGPVLDLVDLTGLVDDEPLLELTLAEGIADAVAPLDGSEADISGSSAGAVVLRISSAVANTLGIPNEVTLAPGIAETIAEGTPLESTITVGQVQPISETLGTAGVATTGARVTATELALPSNIEGGIVVTVGEASARVGGVTPTTSGPPSLPTTGGEIAMAALFVLASLGLAAALYRRRLQI